MKAATADSSVNLKICIIKRKKNSIVTKSIEMILLELKELKSDGGWGIPSARARYYCVSSGLLFVGSF